MKECRLHDCWPGTKCKLRTGYKIQTENKDCFSSPKNYTECHAVAFPRSSFTNISIIWIFLFVSSYILSITKRPGHRLFIRCLPDLPADLPISERQPCYRMRRQRTAYVQRWSCVMSLILGIILHVAFFKYWYDSSRIRWEDMRRLWRLEILFKNDCGLTDWGSMW